MSHTHTHRQHTPRLSPPLSPTPSVQELKEQWDRLPLHPQTRAHLEQVLSAEGTDLAIAATMALSLELAHEEQITRSL